MTATYIGSDTLTGCSYTTLLSVTLLESAMLMVVLLARSTTLCPPGWPGPVLRPAARPGPTGVA